MLDNMFFSVLEVSLSVSIIVVILLFCAPLFSKRYAMKWKYLIWLFLAIRLLIPFDIADVRQLAGKFTEAVSDIREEAQRTEPEDMEHSPDAGAKRQGIVVEIPAQVTEPLMISSGTEAGKLTLLMVIEEIWLVGTILFLSVHIGSYLWYKRQIMQCDRGSALTMQFYGSKQIMKKRFRNILRKTKGKNGLVVTLCAVLLTGSLGALIGCSVSGDETSYGSMGEEGVWDGPEADVAADSTGTGDMVAEGIVADGIDVPETVLEQVKILVRRWFQEAQENDVTANYQNYRIESLDDCYTYEDFHGMTLQVYQLNYEFLSDSPENILPVGGMSISEDGWVTPDYPNSRFLIFRQDEDVFSFLLCLMENDCLPGDDLFTSDLENQLEMEGLFTASANTTL